MKRYDEIISIGSQCNPGLALRQLKIKKETYPFDWVRSNSKIILDVIKTGTTKYTKFNSEILDGFFTNDLDENDTCVSQLAYTRWKQKKFKKSHINSYGQYFTHYTNCSTSELVIKLNRWLKRFFSLLKSDKNILFIHSHEEYIYHKKSRDNRKLFYDYLCKINDYLVENYSQLKFTILNIDIDNTHNDYGNIINRSIKYNLPVSDNGETHASKYYMPYRNEVTKCISNYLKSIK